MNLQMARRTSSSQTALALENSQMARSGRPTQTALLKIHSDPDYSHTTSYISLFQMIVEKYLEAPRVLKYI